MKERLDFVSSPFSFFNSHSILFPRLLIYFPREIYQKVTGNWKGAGKRSRMEQGKLVLGEEIQWRKYDASLFLRQLPSPEPWNSTLSTSACPCVCLLSWCCLPLPFHSLFSEDSVGCYDFKKLNKHDPSAPCALAHPELILMASWVSACSQHGVPFNLLLYFSGRLFEWLISHRTSQSGF